MLVANDIAKDTFNLFNGKIKYVLATDHNESGTSDCKDVYCLVEPGDPEPVVTPVSSSNLVGNNLLGEKLVERINGLAGTESHNSGNIILILQSQGNTDGGSPGYYFKKIYNLIPQFDITNETVHGSLSKYESNIVFVMFSPVTSPSDSKKIEIHSFFTQNFDDNPNYATEPMLYTEIGSIVEDAVKCSNKIFMP